MSPREFPLPEATRLRARSHGDAGMRWLAGLDNQVRVLEEQWRIRVVESLEGGSESLVLAVDREDGTPAILKLALPGAGNLDHEAHVLEIAKGRGYVRLYAYDPSQHALLLERLGVPVARLNVPVAMQHAHICATLQTAWRRLDDPGQLRTGAWKARWLARFVKDAWKALGEPCTAATLDLAVAFAEEREGVFAPENCVLVHGDPHEYNTLVCVDLPVDAEPICRFIDPDGLFAEPAYDLGIVMRSDEGELLAADPRRGGRERCAQLARWTGIDERSIWQWGFIERVSTGLHMMQIGMREAGLQSLAVADLWVAERAFR